MENNNLVKEIDISFCLPVYNVKQFLNESIQSIIKQDIKNISYEILCVDDCSTDGSYEYLLELAEQYSTIRVLRNEKNLKISSTRNRLIKEARGNYIWFIDPDDMLYNNAVQHVFLEMQRVKGEVLYCNYTRIEEGAKGNQEYVFDTNSKARLVDDKEDLPIDEEKRKMNALWAGLFLREFLIGNDLYFNEKMTMQEDAVFYWEFKVRTDKIYKIDAPVYLYRQRTSSLTHIASRTKRKEQYFSQIEKLTIYEKYLKEPYGGDCKVLKRKIQLTKQGIIICLMAFDSKEEIKEQIKNLKKKKIYPYKLSFLAFKGKGNLAVKILRFLLPIKPFFWLNYYLYKKYTNK